MNTPFFLFLGDLGGGEIMLIMVVILIFFGANKIPELARGLGKGIREFKDASSEIRSEIENAGQARPQQQPYNNQYNQPGYQQNTVFTDQPQTAAPAPTEALPAATIAPPMDGGIELPPAEPSRLDQTTN